jgi:hypothetical protein
MHATKWSPTTDVLIQQFNADYTRFKTGMSLEKPRLIEPLEEFIPKGEKGQEIGACYPTAHIDILCSLLQPHVRP